jgi:hypothetical protein
MESFGGLSLRKFVIALLLLAPGLAAASTPPEGVPLKVRRGFFTETDIGAFMTLGGEHGYSNAQTYLQLGVGYDLGENIALGAHFGIGANAANCFAGESGCFGRNPRPENFTLTFLNMTAAYLVPLADRFYLAPKLAAGYTFLDPAPVSGTDGAGITGGFNIGGGLGVEYATSMDHFTIGADVLWRFVIGPNINTLAFFPRVKYTF